jgi:hypothetical protein
MGFCFVSKRMFDAHLFSFFRASSCSILFFRAGATLSTIHLFRGEKQSKCCFISFFFIANATLSSGGIFDSLFFKWWCFKNLSID